MQNLVQLARQAGRDRRRRLALRDGAQERRDERERRRGLLFQLSQRLGGLRRQTPARPPRPVSLLRQRQDDVGQVANLSYAITLSQLFQFCQLGVILGLPARRRVRVHARAGDEREIAIDLVHFRQVERIADLQRLQQVFFSFVKLA